MASRAKPVATNYRFRLAKEGVEFEVEGDRQFVLDLIARFAPTGGVPQPAHKAGQKSVSGKGNLIVHDASISVTAGKSISIREFIQQLDIKKHIDYVLAFGYYLEKHSGLKSFAPADLNVLYYEAKMETSNTSQMIILNIRRGYMMESKDADSARKRYVLTTSGEKHVEGMRTAGG